MDKLHGLIVPSAIKSLSTTAGYRNPVMPALPEISLGKKG